MNQAQLREEVAGFYPGQKWKTRVYKMSAQQVRLIYNLKKDVYGGRKRTNQGGVSEQQKVGSSR